MLSQPLNENYLSDRLIFTINKKDSDLGSIEEENFKVLNLDVTNLE